MSAEPGSPLLEVRQLEAWYGGAQVLFGVDLDVRPGETVVLIGRNGAGKSTALKAIMGLEVRRRGSIRFAGVPIEGLATHAIARLGLGFVPEDRRVFAGLTVAENLVTGRQPARGGHAWSEAELYGLFPNLAEFRDRRGGLLSGGEQQMLTIARTLMGNPRCLLLDEPSEGLAPIILDGIAAAIRALKRRGVGLLVAEQSLAFARAIADRAYVVEQGRIRFAGTLDELDRTPGLRDQYLAL